MSNIKEISKHSGNYLLATLATKALAFISIPIYTYLLTVEEYGIYNVFISTTGIATVLLSLNTEVAVSRFYYDAKNEIDFKRFVGTSTRLTFLAFAFMSLLLILFCEPIAEFLGFEKLLTLSIIPVSLYAVINSVFQQIYQPLLKSRKVATVSSVQSYLAFALSTICIIILPEKKYYGLVCGTIIAMILLSVYSINQIKVYYKGCWDISYIKYILHYSIPYLPYSLSGIIIAQIGKLILGQEQGFESAGLYSFASNIALLMMILINVVHSAWNPYYFRYMNESDFKSLDNDYDLIWRITLLSAAGLSLFGYELGALLGHSDYLNGLYLIPILSLGYCFYQWSYVYMRNVGYAKQTIWNALVVVISGCCNVALNYVLAKSYKEVGIAISFMISYVIMFVLSWLVNAYILRLYVPKTISFFVPLCCILPVVVYSFFNPFLFNVFVTIFVKLLIFIIFVFVIFYKYRNEIIEYIGKKK